MQKNDHANNNFNLIRLLAATLVIVDHSFPLTGTPAPVFNATHLGAPGGVCVDVFFLTSGHLVTKSLLARGDIVQFITARIVRIYPALLVLTVLTLLLAACCAQPGLLTNPQTWAYALHTALPSLALLTTYRLPGVFEANPFPGVVNGSLWTLPWELRMYAILGAAWIATRAWRSAGDRPMHVVIVALALLGLLTKIGHPDSPTVNLVFMFFSGAAFHVLRQHVRYRLDVAAACAVVLALSILYRPAFVIAYHLCLGYILFTLAYVPKCWQPRHDYSYGIYIYAFPIQQTLVLLFPGIAWYEMAAAAIPLAVAAGALSWHLIEKPALRLKDMHARWTAPARKSDFRDTISAPR